LEQAKDEISMQGRLVGGEAVEKEVEEKKSWISTSKILTSS
jgi:hypothetical protein